jgi:hypothetical protein
MREEKSSAKCLMGGTSPQISGNKAKIVDPELITPVQDPALKKVPNPDPVLCKKKMEL